MKNCTLLFCSENKILGRNNTNIRLIENCTFDSLSPIHFFFFFDKCYISLVEFKKPSKLLSLAIFNFSRAREGVEKP